jgi:hypothetical protein
MERAKEDVKDLEDERNAVLITATGFAMVGLLIGLLTFFVAFAPAS